MTYTEETLESDAELVSWLLIHGFADVLQDHTDLVLESDTL